MWRLFAVGGIAAVAVPMAARAVWPIIQPTVKGFLGEASVRRRLRAFRGKDYSKVHNILIPGSRGTTQIDHVLVSRHGIFVIEAKNYSGTIIGGEKTKFWTQKFPSGYTTTFLNPLFQNVAHVKAVRSLLHKYPNIPYYSIVAFGNGSSLPPIPNVVKMRHLKMAISARCRSTPALSREEVKEIGAILSGSNITSRKAREQHDIKAHLASDAAKNVTQEMLDELMAKSKTAPLLYFGDPPPEREVPQEQAKLTDAGAMLTIRNRTSSIAQFLEGAKRDANGNRVPEGAPFDHFICPFTGDSFPASEAKHFYEGLWVAYLNKNPDLVDYMRENSDRPHGNSFRCQRVLTAYMQDPDGFTDQARDCDWYRNVAQKQQKRRPLDEQIRGAEGAGRKPTPNKETHDSIDR